LGNTDSNDLGSKRAQRSLRAAASRHQRWQMVPPRWRYASRPACRADLLSTDQFPKGTFVY
jgi:hypothetical protein